MLLGRSHDQRGCQGLSLLIWLVLLWGLDISEFLDVECIAWYLVWFAAAPTSHRPGIVLLCGVVAYLMKMETGDEGSCTYSRFLWVNLPPQVPDTDLRAPKGSHRIKNIYYSGPVFLLEKCLYHNKKEWFSPTLCHLVLFSSHLTHLPWLIWFYLHLSQWQKSHLSLQPNVFSWASGWWSQFFDGPFLWRSLSMRFDLLKVEFSVFYPNFLLFLYSRSCWKVPPVTQSWYQGMILPSNVLWPDILGEN